MEGMIDLNWKPLLPKIKCPLCGKNLKELRMKDVLAWVCNCEEFKKLEKLAK